MKMISTLLPSKLGRLCVHRTLNHIFRNFVQMAALFSSQNMSRHRIVYHSQSKNIYQNLALEEWIFENTDLAATDVLLVWQSDPCVVIGRHQNPWTEMNVSLIEKDSITVARRTSGGGAVYHDNGNLNLSFMKDRSRYNRVENLQLVISSLASKWNLDLHVNERDDIVLDGKFKVSGTAAKLSRNKSYHHFTLLHSVDQAKLSGVLSSPLLKCSLDSKRESQAFVDSKSTQSVPSTIRNLQSRAPEMTFDLMLNAIVDRFLDVPGVETQQLVVKNPMDESLFPGVVDIRKRLESWDWIHGKTPKFSVKMETRWQGSDIEEKDDFVETVTITIEKGCVSSLCIVLNNGTVIDLAYVLNVKGLSVKKETLKLFTDLNIVFGNVFTNAYPHLNVVSLSRSAKECFSKLHEIL